MSTPREWQSQDGKTMGPLVGPWELFGRDARVIPLFGKILSSIGMDVIASDSVPFLAENIFGSLMLLSQESSDPVKIVINSEGGSVIAGFDIIRGMAHLQEKNIEVWTIDAGASFSMASIVLAAGTKGKRFAFKGSTIHLHSGTVHSGAQRPEDKEMLDRYLENVRLSLNRVLVERTKIAEYYVKSTDTMNPKLLDNEEGRLKVVREFLGREQYLTPEQALEAGVIDHILEPGNAIIDEIFRLKNADREKGVK